MKRIQMVLALVACGLALNIHSAPRPADPPAVTPPAAKEQEKAAAPAENAPATAVTAPAQEGTNSSQAAVVTGDGLLRLNLRNVPLDQVLNYFSEAAGYIINVRPGTSVRGKVDVWSNQPLTREDALTLLDTVLNQNGLARVLTGKTLTIVNRDEVKTQPIPVNIGTDPESIPQSDQVVTQIIPVRFVEVGQLLKDLQPLVSMQTTMTANEAGNAIVITDTQTSIRRVAEIIKAIDSGAEAFTEVRVFRLLHADCTEMADELTSLFPDDTRQGNSQSPVQFRGLRGLFGGGGGGGGFPGGGGANAAAGGDNSARLKKRARVIAVADPRTASVMVSAAKELMDQIAEVVTTLDNDSKGLQTVATFNIAHADLQEILPVLQDMFQKNTTTQSRNNSQSQTDLLTTRLQQLGNQSSSSSAAASSTGRSSGAGGNRSVGGSLP